MTAYLPNLKKGHFYKMRIPQYVLDILENVKPTQGHDIGRFGLDTYRLRGVNPVRPGYGIKADMEKLGAWVERYGADFEIIYFCDTPKNYYGIFKMTDPVAHGLEKVGLL
ncbi:MAG: hypothetical protein LBC86_03985 [Oscillospiraceae bacterium]|jgi:hypothetical protein|nr:hypothetical protein [Oscillospiraceae bacterium]